MNWQDYVAIGLVHLALFVMVRGYFRRRKQGCASGCGSCGAGERRGPTATELLTIGNAERKDPQISMLRKVAAAVGVSLAPLVRE